MTSNKYFNSFIFFLVAPLYQYINQYTIDSMCKTYKTPKAVHKLKCSNTLHCNYNCVCVYLEIHTQAQHKSITHLSY